MIYSLSLCLLQDIYYQQYVLVYGSSKGSFPCVAVVERGRGVWPSVLRLEGLESLRKTACKVKVYCKMVWGLGFRAWSVGFRV